MAAARNVSTPYTSLPNVAQNALNTPSPGGPFKATQLWKEIIGHLKLHVSCKRKRIRLKQYDQCFTGSDAVDVILHHLLLDNVNFRKDISRAKAVKLCQLIMDSKVFESINSHSAKLFEDSSNKFYRFKTEGGVADRKPLISTPSKNSPSSHPGSKMRINKVFEPDLLDGDNVISNPILLNNKGQIIQELMNTSETWKRRSSMDLLKRTISPALSKGTFSRQRQAHEFKSMRTGKPRTPLADRINISDRLNRSLRKRRLDMSFDDCDTPKAVADEIWREVALNKLLTLIELPLLDTILSSDLDDVSPNLPNLVISNLQLGLESGFLIKETVLSGPDLVKPDPWLTAATECLELQPDKMSVIYATRSRHKSCESSSKLRKKALYQEIVDVYTKNKKRSPLISDRFMDLHVAIFNLLMQGRLDVAVKAVQLSMLLLPQSKRDELEALVKFLHEAISESAVHIGDIVGSNRAEIQHRFADVILHNTMLSASQASKLVMFIIDHYPEVFKVPEDIQQIVTNRLECLKKGRLCTVEEESDADLSDWRYDDTLSVIDMTAYCERVTMEQYKEQQENYTNEAICDLINTVLDDTKIPLKEKRERLKLLKKNHPEIYNENFAGMV
ncbi:unnamed protein product [Owenia fusiformis]|uniref:Uncharacterized protein n=1 Tax=Owenia fusiformis TaxID=6347 RepID=A0A8J1XKD6_OWEFU|nr:unnamed protein product [Owenia fusiformis]